MSRMNDLSVCTNDLKAAAQALLSVADGLTELFSGDAPAEDAPKQEAAPTPDPITKEQVRAVLAKKSTAGFGKEVRALLKAHNAIQLSDVNPDDYADLMQAAQTIGMVEVQADAR